MNLFGLIGAGFFLALAAAAQSPAAPAPDAVCHMCGMDSTRSQTEFVIHWSDGTHERACCLHCVYLLDHFVRDRKRQRVETRDFSSGALIDAETAWYLGGSSVIPKGSMAPFLPAFGEEETARTYLRKYGGEIVDWAGALGVVERFDGEISGGISPERKASCQP